MATFTVSNVERHSDGSPWAYGGVKIAVAGPDYDSNGGYIGGTSYEQTDASGSVTLSNLTVGVVYTWTHADGTQENFTAGSAGTYALDALITTAGPPVPGSVTPGSLAAQLSGYVAQSRFASALPAQVVVAAQASFPASGTDITQAWRDAITAAGSNGLVVLPAGDWEINDEVQHGNGVAPVGVAAGNGVVGTTIKLTTALARVAFGVRGTYTTRGPKAGGFNIDGQSTAAAGLYLASINRHFEDIRVTGCAGDGVLMEGAQNNQLVSVRSDGNARNWTFDYGAGGNQMFGCYSNAHTSAAVTFKQSVPSDSASPYPQPQQNVFWGGVFERGAVGAAAVVNHSAGQNNQFYGSVFDGSAQTAAYTLVKVTLSDPSLVSSDLLLVNPRFSGDAEKVYVTALSVATNCHALVLGDAQYNNIAYAFGCEGGNIDDMSTGRGSLANRYGGTLAASGTTYVRRRISTVQGFISDGVGIATDVISVSTESGARQRRMGNGDIHWANGSNFNWDTILGRDSAGSLLHVTDGSGNVKFYTRHSGAIFVDVFGTAVSNTNWSTLTQNNAAFYGAHMQSTGAQNATVSFLTEPTRPGTYTLDLFSRTNTDAGIVTVAIDGTTVGTVDQYAAVGSSLRSSLTGIVLTAGEHTITLTMATKNASSSSYAGRVSGIKLIRTGS